MRYIKAYKLLTEGKKDLDDKKNLLKSYEAGFNKIIKDNNIDVGEFDDIIVDFKDADYVGNERIVFNIARNKFRLIASFNYQFNACWIKFVGTHKEYDKVDAKTVEFY